MRFYALVDYRLQETVELYPTREDAQDALRQVLVDEPEFEGVIGVAEIEFEVGRN